MSEKKLLKCPECNSTKLRFFLVNRFKQRHYYVVQCRECNWYQKFNHHSKNFYVYEDTEDVVRCCLKL